MRDVNFLILFSLKVSQADDKSAEVQVQYITEWRDCGNVWRYRLFVTDIKRLI